MGERRKQQFEGGQRRRRDSVRWGPQNRDSSWNWNHGKPPRIPDELQVPRWEIEFCRFEGLQWHKLLEAKQFTDLYENVLNWNDSAGEQAFRNAKARYWAKINGFEYDKPVPGPDLYIDKVDQDEIADPSLYDDLSDVDREYDNNGVDIVNKEEAESVIIWGDFFATHQTNWDCPDLPVIATGWGDLTEPDKPSGSVIPTGWEDTEVGSKKEGKIIPTGWGDTETESNTNWNVNESSNYGNYNNNNDGYNWGNENYYGDMKRYENHGAYGNWGRWNKRRSGGNGNWNWNKKWKKKNSNGAAGQDKSTLFCARDNRLTRYPDGLKMQWTVK